MSLSYNRLSPSPGIYGHHRGHSSFLVEMFGAERQNDLGHFYGGGAKHTLSTYFPGGYGDPIKVRTFCSFLICSSCLILRLKKNLMSQSCRAHLFYGASWFSKIQGLNFFCLLDFFSSFLWLACQKIQEKMWQTQWNTLNNKLLQLLCSALYLVHPKSSSIFQSCDRPKSDTFAAQKEKKRLKKRI